METLHFDGTPLATYLEGEGCREAILQDDIECAEPHCTEDLDPLIPTTNFAPPPRLPDLRRYARKHKRCAPSMEAVKRLRLSWSSAVNSRINRIDNERFLEHFRYIIVASQLLNEHHDHAAFSTSISDFDGALEDRDMLSTATSLYGAGAIAVAAFGLVYLIHLTRADRGEAFGRGRLFLIYAGFAIVSFLVYIYIRSYWLKVLREEAVMRVSALTSTWQAFETTTGSALSMIQEVELVSRGYGLSKPISPVSRIEDNTAYRRCGRLRKAVHQTFEKMATAIIETCENLRPLITEETLERYFEVYDIKAQDVQDGLTATTTHLTDNDHESLKSLRAIGHRISVLRRIALCSLMALETDGSKSDFLKWRTANATMRELSGAIREATRTTRSVLDDMDTIVTPMSPVHRPSAPARDRLRSQARRISALSSGIRAMQAKMQILCEETNTSITNEDDLTDLGPNLLAQYDAIGADLRELQQVWETGKALLQTNLSQSDRSSRFSLGSGIARSSTTSIGGLTAVEEISGAAGGPADALKALSGESGGSKRSSMATSYSDEEYVFEAIALPRQRSSLSRDERITRMHEERERQAALRARRDANTSMLRELESVISLRPKKGERLDGQPRITSV